MATCTRPLVTYTCSNASGTTCTKVATTVYVTSANTTCPTGELALLTPTEYATFLARATTLTTLTNQVSALQGVDTTQGSTIAGLQTSTSGYSSTITQLQNDVNLMKAGAASFTGIAGNPNPAVIQAQSVIFGLVMGCAALIWGCKKLLQQFQTTWGES